MSPILALIPLMLVQPRAAGHEPLHQTERVEVRLAPDFSLKSVDGRRLRLKELRGKTVLLNFWATWCPPCLAELPQLVKLQKKYEHRGFRVVGITYPPARRARVRAIIANLKVDYPVVVGTRKVGSLYGVADTLPVSILIDRDGRIIKRIDGMAHSGEIESAIP
jgi:thiol-disulfide isomerase/thioredoxin